MTATKKTPLFFLLPLSLLLLSLIFPQVCINGAKNGLEIGLFSALPSLFPAMVLSKMTVLSLGEKGGKASIFLPFLLGALCGFPVGAYVVAELCKKGALHRREGEKMLLFCNNPGPAFLVGFCGNTVFQRALVGWFFFGAQTLLSLFFFLIFFIRKEKRKDFVPIENSEPRPSFGESISLSLKESSLSFLYILSCIIFFSFLTALSEKLFSLPPFFRSIFALGLEITGGIRTLSSLPRKTALFLCGAGLGFGGASVHFQTLGVIREASLSPKLYFLGKLLFALFLGLSAQIFGKCL